MKKVILLYSGGLDSTVLLYDLLNQNYDVYCLSVNYSQRHKIEIEQATKISYLLGLEHTILDLSCLKSIFGLDNALTGLSDVPNGHYTDKSMEITAVPNRNMILLSIATAYAIGQKADYVAIANHLGDHPIYPDCRVEFIEAIQETISFGNKHQVTILNPFNNLSKTDIVKRGNRLEVPFELTHSCYKGKDKHCGLCGTCTERKESFKLANIIDKTIYED